MHLTRFQDAGSFYRRAAQFLTTREAEHNLILGLCVDIAKHPERYVQQPYFAVVEHDQQVVLVALMTPPHSLTLSLCDAEGAIELRAEDVSTFSPHPPGVSGPGGVSAMFAQAWERRGHVKARKKLAMRIYKLNQVHPVRAVSGRMRRTDIHDLPLLAEWFTAFDHEALGVAHPEAAEARVLNWLSSEVRGLFVWEIDREPVTMAGYSGPTPNSMRINAVYTPHSMRRRGYASALVAALSQHLFDQGRQFCTLYTDLSNPTSNHIYQAIGYAPVIDADEWRFE